MCSYARECPQKSDEADTEALGAGVRGGRELPSVGAGNGMLVLCKVLLMADRGLPGSLISIFAKDSSSLFPCPAFALYPLLVLSVRSATGLNVLTLVLLIDRTSTWLHILTVRVSTPCSFTHLEKSQEAYTPDGCIGVHPVLKMRGKGRMVREASCGICAI